MTKLSLTLPLPPSINRVYFHNPYTHRRGYKKEGTQYLEVGTLLVKKFVKKYNIKPFNDYFYLDLEFWLPRQNCDSHNYLKLSMDVLQHGGLVENDKWIMNRTQEIKIDKENPRIRLTIQI